jgi:hypothetical protein
MEHIRIRNWDKWQSYRKDRGQPPWIKIHRCVMRNPDWVALTDSERGQVVAIWLLAADHDGVIPASPQLIQKLCFMTKPPNLNKFADLGFLDDGWRQGGVKVTSDCQPDDAPEKNRIEKNRGEKNILSPPTLLLGQFQNVKLTEVELQKLKDAFGEEGAKERIENLSSYIASKGKKYHSHYATILTWERKNNGNTKTDSEVDRGLAAFLAKEDDESGN